MLSHTDVVLADPKEWERDPFGGELVDGHVWGRGALDMKGEVAASAVAMAGLAREGWRGSGDLIFIAAADEEVGDGFGLQWLVETHPDAVRADFSVNEGAGDRVELGGKVLYLCSTAEKMSSPFTLRVRGRSGHASMPSIADNALVKAAPLVARLGEFAVEPQLIPEVEGFFGALLGRVPAAPNALAVAREVAPLAGELIEPLLGMTVSPTMAHASDKRNVIPALCEITVDIRLLPGQTPADAEAIVRRWLGPGDYELENTEAYGGTRSAIGGALWDAVQSFVEEEEPGAAAAPICVAGFTDSHWMREAFGTVAYGFFPSRTMDSETAARLIHSANERVPVDDLELGVRFMRHAARSVCA
jgi:acetylornithine deacetylase/succinyl-diaminopimelate desuccinylase-like protein